MMRGALYLLCALFLFACGSKNDKPTTVEQAVEQVKLFEDSLRALKVDPNRLTDPNIGVKYAEKCLSVAHQFPDSKETPASMDKAHIIFASLGMHARSVAVGDTLIRMYPTYKNRPMVLQSMASAYDLFLQPRRKDKVLFYYNLLLKENPGLPKDQREMIENRIKYIDLTFEQMIDTLQ